MKKRTVLLLGATGLVGENVLAGLLGADFCERVITMTRSPVSMPSASSNSMPGSSILSNPMNGEIRLLPTR